MDDGSFLTRMREGAVRQKARQTPLSSPGLTGRSSIPEAALIEPRSRGVLDAPVKPGHDSGVNGGWSEVTTSVKAPRQVDAHHVVSSDPSCLIGCGWPLSSIET